MGAACTSPQQQREEMARKYRNALPAYLDVDCNVTSRSIVVADGRDVKLPLTYVTQDFLSLTGFAMGDVIGRNCAFLQGRETDRGVVAAMHDNLGRNMKSPKVRGGGGG
jgi:hypothetical protein